MLKEEKNKSYYHAENLSPNKARLWKLVNDLKADFCIYLLDTNYDDQVEKKLVFKANRYDAYFYKNNNNQALKLYAVKEQNSAKGSIFLIAPIQYQYIIGNYTIEHHNIGTWQLIDDNKVFLNYHRQHRLLNLITLLNETKPMQNLREFRLKLLKESKKNIHAFAKFKAVDAFLQALDNNNYNIFFDILQSPNNETYLAMIKPRPCIYHIGNFFKIDFTARSPRHTTTFQTLTNLISLEEFDQFEQEYLTQNQMERRINTIQ